jgi:hypothetical protein
VAARLNISGQAFSGRATSPGDFRRNLDYSVFSIGGEGQFFLWGGNAYRHLGGYLIAGASADFERFSASYWDPDDDPSRVERRTRLGGTAGFGYSFRPNGGVRWTVEAVFHKTLTSSDTLAGDPPAGDFVKIGAGVVF